jgi:hypothetical protein
MAMELANEMLTQALVVVQGEGLKAMDSVVIANVEKDGQPVGKQSLHLDNLPGDAGYVAILALDSGFQLLLAPGSHGHRAMFQRCEGLLL